MRNVPSALIVLLLLSCVATVPVLAQAQDETEEPTTSAKPLHHRELWMLGISLGAGPGQADNRLNGETMDEWGGVVQLRGGGMIHPKVLFHIDLEAWLRDQAVGSSSYKVDMFQYALALTWYPFDPAGRSGGWWLRGGLGLANLRVEPDGNFSGEGYTEGGWSSVLAAGYEFRVGRTVALGLGLSYDNLGISGDVFESTRFFALTADLNWYLD